MDIAWSELDHVRFTMWLHCELDWLTWKISKTRYCILLCLLWLSSLLVQSPMIDQDTERFILLTVPVIINSKYFLDCFQIFLFSPTCSRAFLWKGYICWPGTSHPWHCFTCSDPYSWGSWYWKNSNCSDYSASWSMQEKIQQEKILCVLWCSCHSRCLPDYCHGSLRFAVRGQQCPQQTAWLPCIPRPSITCLG